jgi:hypothetical protein
VSGNPEAGLVGFGLSRPPGHARRSERPLSGKREDPRQRPLLAATRLSRLAKYPYILLVLVSG